MGQQGHGHRGTGRFAARYDQGNPAASLPRGTREGPIDRQGRPILVGAIQRQHRFGPGRVIGRTATRSDGRSLPEGLGSSVTAMRRAAIGLRVGNSTVTHRRANVGQRRLQGRAVRAVQGVRAALLGHDGARVALRDDLVHRDRIGRNDRVDRVDRAVQMV